MKNMYDNMKSLCWVLSIGFSTNCMWVFNVNNATSELCVRVLLQFPCVCSGKTNRQGNTDRIYDVVGRAVRARGAERGLGMDLNTQRPGPFTVGVSMGGQV